MASRGHLDSSVESDASVTIKQMIQATNELSELLDDQHNQDFSPQSLSKDASKATLHRLLSVRTTVSTSSSSATFQYSQRNQAVGFRKIGFGQCGLVFERPGRGYVLKVARPHFHDALWVDFVCHFLVYNAFQQHSKMECRVPTVYSYVTKRNTQWWTTHTSLFEEHDTFPLPSMALITERILPLPKVVRHALIEEYCPSDLQSKAMLNPPNRDCLVRLYMGKRRAKDAPPPPNFTLRNFNLCLDQMLDLELPVSDYACALGEALAVMHWQANVDGYDVEFVLGSEANAVYTRDVSADLQLTPEMVRDMQPHTDIESLLSANFRKRTTRIWVLDFNLCTHWDKKMAVEHSDALLAQLVYAFFENDPYFPLPLVPGESEVMLWSKFSSSYIDKARMILGQEEEAGLKILPDMFLAACIKREEEKLSQGLGHGHRENKG